MILAAGNLVAKLADQGALKVFVMPPSACVNTMLVLKMPNQLIPNVGWISDFPYGQETMEMDSSVLRLWENEFIQGSFRMDITFGMAIERIIKYANKLTQHIRAESHY